MLDVLISNKTRIKLLFRFFLNPGEAAYLRGLEKEFDENSNSIRMELNRFESAGILSSYEDGNKKMYAVNTGYPLFGELQSLAMKHFGVDIALEEIVGKLGKPTSVYLTGQLARGLDSNIIDLAIVGEHIDRPFLASLSDKAEKLVGRKIRTMILHPEEIDTIPEPRMLIYGK
ncbi:MAG: ArsR family transcriptional regulator [Bacteroidetes bacterium]|nr:ArsR family transcriptional regulator [Bacteroidota bacterium]